MLGVLACVRTARQRLGPVGERAPAALAGRVGLACLPSLNDGLPALTPGWAAAAGLPVPAHSHNRPQCIYH